MIRLFLIALAAALALPALAADPGARPASGRFVAICEDLGRFCGAEACGRDQIDAALACRALCPGSVMLTVGPAACAPPGVVLRRRG